MSALAPTMEAFFTERLVGQRQVSPHTVAAYADTFRLLLAFVQRQSGKAPSRLNLADLDATVIGAFLDYLERERGNAVRTRNSRLAAIHSLFRFAALRHPEHAALIQRVLALPPKRFDRAVVSFLSRKEVDAVLASPDRTRWIGRRDHALLVVAIQTGLRVSELTGLHCQDAHLRKGAHLRCFGKGRKERVVPIALDLANALKSLIRERNLEEHDQRALFVGTHGERMTRFGATHIVRRAVASATTNKPELKKPNRSRSCSYLILGSGPGPSSMIDPVNRSSYSARAKNL